jgi:hypothetical protein
LKLTRANILYDDLDRDYFGDEWFEIHAPHDTENFIVTNKETMFDFLNPKMDLFKLDQGHNERTEDQKHLVSRISMKDCLENFLNKLKYTRESDSAKYSSLRGILKRYLEQYPDEECLIYLMSANSLSDWKIRNRRLDTKGHDEVQELFQGKNPRTGLVIYPGDREIKNDDLVSIQIHRLHITGMNGENILDEEGNIKYIDVPTLAIWIPKNIGKDIIRQA